MTASQHQIARIVALVCWSTVSTLAAAQSTPITTRLAFASGGGARLGTVVAAAYGFPFKGEELLPTERYATDKHRTGIQALGKDIIAVRHLGGTSWNEFGNVNLTGNARYVIYNRPFYAMADGEVVGCWRNAPENRAGSSHRDLLAGKFARGGNHLWILQTDGIYALYAHAISETIPSNLARTMRCCSPA